MSPSSLPFSVFMLVFAVLASDVSAQPPHFGDETLLFAIDSGSSANILDTKSLPRVDSYLINQRQARVAGLGHQQEAASSGVLAGMELGGIPYLPMHTVVKDIGYFNARLPGPKIDGILGFYFLRQYKTAINLKKKALYIWNQEQPGEHLSEREGFANNR